MVLCKGEGGYEHGGGGDGGGDDGSGGIRGVGFWCQ